MQKTLRAPLWRVLASVLTAALIASGAALGVAVPAQAAGGPTLTVTAAPRAGGTVTVTGTGFAPAAPGVYLGIGPAGLPGFYQGASSISQVVWIAPGNPAGSTDAGPTAPMAADGSFSVELTVPAYADGAAFSLYTSKAHGQGFMDPSQNVIQPVTYAAAPATATTTTLTVDSASIVVGATVTLTAVVAPAAAGSVEFRDGATPIGSAPVVSGSASLPTASLAVGAHELTAAFTPTDPTLHAASTSAAVPVAVAAVPALPVPTVTVSKTTGLDAEGETVTVTGSGFVANAPATSGARPPLAGRFAGAYVVFGSFADVWQPTAGAPSSARKTFDTKWGVLASDMAAIGGPAAGAIEITPEGTFSTTLTVSEAEGALADGNWGVYTDHRADAHRLAERRPGPVRDHGADDHG
ncbi:MAG: hypothetical protein K0Q58_1259 [Microbacterium sp.]|nr:hypothetical protein [Microbacterium sp.]